jgi:hypothetical protein
MRILTGMCVALLATVGAAQEDDQAIWDAFAPYEKTVRGVSGVLEITVGKVKGERGILVRVQTTNAKESVQILIGDRVGDYPVHAFVGTVTAGADGCTRCPLHCGGGKTVAGAGRTSGSGPGQTKVDTARLNDPTYAQERCDVIRKWLGLPRLEEGDVRCQEMVGTTNNPSRIKWVIAQGMPHWRSEEMPTPRGSDVRGLPCGEHGTHNAGDMISYAWVKHRQFCPLGAKIILKGIEDQTPTENPRR